jgi:hypothetical protein
MSKFLTDKYLKYVAALRGKTIEGDDECEYCGYSLRGLRYGKVCPECGTPIRYRREPDLAFHEMPLPLIRSFRLSCWMAGLAFAACGWIIFNWATGGMSAGSGLGMLLMAAVVGLWVTAVWRLTRPLEIPQAIRHGFSPRDRLRNGARWLQFGWVLAFVAQAASQAQGVISGPTGPFNLLTVIGILLGVIGIGVLALFLARFAAWVRDEFAAKAFATAVWGTVFLAPLVLLMPVISATIGALSLFVVPMIAVLIALLLVASIAAFPVGLFSLSRSIDWSLVHARDRTDRDREMHERMATRAPQRPETTDPIKLAEPRSDTPPETPTQPPETPF